MLVEQYRGRCLWFLRPDFYPTTDAVLEYIERYGDVDAFRRAARLKRRLLQTSNAPSAA
jgi:hypothetical protein